MSNETNPWAPPPADGPQDPSYNPYAPPKAHLGGASGSVENAEAIRRDHLSHEASLRSVGCLYFWTGVLAFLFAVVSAVVGIAQFVTKASGSLLGSILGVLIVYLLLGWLLLWIGRGLRDLEGKVRIALTILSAIGLLVFPVGSVINAYVLYLLYSAKGQRIMTEEYRHVVAQTPYLKYRTPFWVWVVVIAVIVLVIYGVVFSSSF